MCIKIDCTHKLSLDTFIGKDYVNQPCAIAKSRIEMDDYLRALILNAINDLERELKRPPYTLEVWK
jgi:hypothetical protein